MCITRSMYHFSSRHVMLVSDFLYYTANILTAQSSVFYCVTVYTVLTCTALVTFDYYTKCCAVHRGAFCQFPFQWIYYCYSSKSTRKKSGKTHLCAVVYILKICTPEIITTGTGKSQKVVFLAVQIFAVW